MSESEDTLLEKAVGGDDEALAALLKHYGPQVRRDLQIGAKWQSTLDADDVMQVSYLEAYLRIDRFTPKGSKAFLAWLRQIAQNNLRDAIKALKCEKRPPPSKRIAPPVGDEAILLLYHLLGATNTTPSSVVARREAKSSLETALRELPPDYARVVRLHDLEGLSGPEVAAATGRSRGAIFMLRARALERLRELLGTGSQFFSTGT